MERDPNINTNASKLQKTHKRVVFKNTMYDRHLMATTNRLQDDLRTTMKAYNNEKDKLVHQLSALNTTDGCSTASIESTGDMSPAMKRRQFFRAPNLAVSSRNTMFTPSTAESSEGLLASAEKRWRDRKDLEKMKKEKELLKLPVIHSATKRSEWDSGKLWQSESPRPLPGIEPLPGITTAKALLVESMKIPSIYDPQRSDTAFDRNKSKSPRKKVTFADEKHGLSLEEDAVDSSKIFGDSKNFQRNGVVPKLQLTPNQFSHASKQSRPRKMSLLPPLNITMESVRKNPQKVTQGVNEWKSLYSSIVDPEKRTRALNDILQAVRLKKIENEQAMKYGDSPRPADKDTILHNFLSLSATDKILYRNEYGQKCPGMVPTPRHTAGRIGRRSNSQQLQNYLNQLSRERRMADHMAVEEFKLAHVYGHKALQDALKHTATPVPVTG